MQTCVGLPARDSEFPETPFLCEEPYYVCKTTSGRMAHVSHPGKQSWGQSCVCKTNKGVLLFGRFIRRGAFFFFFFFFFFLAWSLQRFRSGRWGLDKHYETRQNSLVRNWGHWHWGPRSLVTLVSSQQISPTRGTTRFHHQIKAPEKKRKETRMERGCADYFLTGYEYTVQFSRCRPRPATVLFITEGDRRWVDGLAGCKKHTIRCIYIGPSYFDSIWFWPPKVRPRSGTYHASPLSL